jgi:hypothetical protein
MKRRREHILLQDWTGGPEASIETSVLLGKNAGRELWKRDWWRSRHPERRDNRFAELLLGVPRQVDEVAVSMADFTMGRYVRTDHPAAGKKGFSNGQAKAFGPGRSNKRFTTRVAPLQLRFR